MRSYIDTVRDHANDNWGNILPALNISINKKEGPCPACGGNTRYRFDDKEGRGTYFCSHCGAGTGLDLVMKVNNCNAMEGAKMVANVLSLPLPNNQQKPARKKPQISIADTVATLVKRTHMGESSYLNKKGLYGSHQILEDGSLLLPLQTIDGIITGAQIIRPQGEKRLIFGTKKKGAFIPIGDIPEAPETIIISEGYATALTVRKIKSDAFVVASIDASNLLSVAEIMKSQYRQAKIIIAADNDNQPNEKNIGKVKAEQAAMSVSGWITLPPTNDKSDWDDYRQQYGIEAASIAFNEELYQLTKERLLTENRILGDGQMLSDYDVQILESINKEYTHVTIGGKHKVLSLKPCQVNGVTHSFEDLSQFVNYFLHSPGVAGKIAGKAWLKWPGKSYKPGGIGFYPAAKKCPETVYNMFMGLSVEPVQGDCLPYLEHIKQVICNGDETSYTYLIGWMAHLIQHPDEKPSVAIVMKSIQGAGKGTMVRPLQEILGQYAVHINGAGQITGKFNATMANKLLVFADEVTIGRNYEGDRLKAIISERTMNLERKGIDPEPMPNFTRFIFASNSTQALKAGIRERRYLVLEPNPKKAQNKGYFDNLYAWLKDNGAGKLLYFLHHYDLKDFDCYRCPQTKELQEEIIMGMKGVYAYLYDELSKDRPFQGMARIPVSDVIDKYLMWCTNNHEYVTTPAARSGVGKAFSAIGMNATGRRGRNLGIIYELLEIEKFREQFAKAIGMEHKDIF